MPHLHPSPLPRPVADSPPVVVEHLLEEAPSSPDSPTFEAPQEPEGVKPTNHIKLHFISIIIHTFGIIYIYIHASHPSKSGRYL